MSDMSELINVLQLAVRGEDEVAHQFDGKLGTNYSRPLDESVKIIDEKKWKTVVVREQLAESDPNTDEPVPCNAQN